MRTSKHWMLLFLTIAAFGIIRLLPSRPAPAVAAENQSAPPFADQVSRIMGSLGNGRIDDAMSSPTFLPDDPAARQNVRNKLLDLRNTQARYRGYDIVAVQRLSDRLQIASILAYFDTRPLLYKIQFYRPSGNTQDAWTVIGFKISDDVMAELKDVPVDYPDHALHMRY